VTHSEGSAPGRTKVVRSCKTRRRAPITEEPELAQQGEIPHESTPLLTLMVVDGSSPSEGLKYLHIGIFCCLC